MSDPIGALRESVLAAVAEVHPTAEVEPTLERPPKPEFGDFSTNAALLLAPIVGEKPRDVAARLEDALRSRLGDELRDVQIAGPGFLNLFLADSWFTEAGLAIKARGDAGAPLGPCLLDRGGGAGEPGVGEIEVEEAGAGDLHVAQLIAEV